MSDKRASRAADRARGALVLVVLLALSTLAFAYLPQRLGSSLLGEFPIVLPLVVVFALLTLAERILARFDH